MDYGFDFTLIVSLSGHEYNDKLLIYPCENNSIGLREFQSKKKRFEKEISIEKRRGFQAKVLCLYFLI